MQLIKCPRCDLNYIREDEFYEQFLSVFYDEVN